MTPPTFTKLTSAYQLHFYLCFKSYRSFPLFAEHIIRDALVEVAQSVCQRQDYHLLETQASDDHLRLLVSLKPEHAVSEVAMMLKGNIARELNLRFANREKKWLGTGYFARTSGRIDIGAARS